MLQSANYNNNNDNNDNNNINDNPANHQQFPDIWSNAAHAALQRAGGKMLRLIIFALFTN